SLFEAIEALVDANFRSGSSFDSQISTDYGAVWGRLNDSLTELLAGPGWREKESPRPKVRSKKGSPPTKVDITAEPRKQPRSGDSTNIADEARSLEELFVDAKKLEDREELRERVIKKLSLMAHKKPDYIKQLIAKREISDIMALANKLRLDRTRL